MSDRWQFGDYYGQLADDELARIALSDHLVPQAQEALAAELQKRGLTDLSEYKRALAESAAASSLGNELQIQTQMKQQFAGWMLVFVAWVFALALPFIWIAGPSGSDAIKISVLATLFIAFSCYLGIRARRRGSRAGYILKFMLPLVLLGISTLVVLSSLILNVQF